MENKCLVTLPCTARELEDALHRVCDHAGLWDGTIQFDMVSEKPHNYRSALTIATDTKGEL